MKFLFRKNPEGTDPPAPAGGINVDGMSAANQHGMSDDAQRLLARLAKKYETPDLNGKSVTTDEVNMPKSPSGKKIRFFGHRKNNKDKDKKDQAEKTKSAAKPKARQQHRFSRRRYLREYNGNTLLSLVLTVALFLLLNAGTIIINTVFLIPETNFNQDIGKQSGNLARQIEEDQPKLARLLKRRLALSRQAEKSFDEFTQLDNIRNTFSRMVQYLNASGGIKLLQHNIQEQDTELQGIRTLVLSLDAETTFLDWMTLRGELTKMSGGADIIEEGFIAPPGKSTLTVHIRMARSGRPDG